MDTTADTEIIELPLKKQQPWTRRDGLILGSLADLASRIALFHAPLAASLSRLVGLPRSSLGMTAAHAGLGLMIIGIIAITLWKVEHIVAMKPGERADVGDYTVQFVGETPLTGENYTGRTGQFRISPPGM